MPHTPDPQLFERAINILVVGCGGNGSAIAAGLPYLHQALLAFGHLGGLNVTLIDPDTVSETNCVRQPFCRTEIDTRRPLSWRTERTCSGDSTGKACRQGSNSSRTELSPVRSPSCRNQLPCHKATVLAAASKRCFGLSILGCHRQRGPAMRF